MNDTQYDIDYSGDTPKQTSGQQVPREYDQPAAYQPIVGQARKWVLPGFVRTGGMLLLGACAVFVVEAWAPGPVKPSTLLGSYEAQVEGRVQATKLQLQAKIDRTNALIKLRNDQELAQYNAQAQLINEYYRNGYEVNKILVQGIVRLTEQKRGVEYAQMQQMQAADMSMANMATMWGRILNLASPSAGDDALEYSNKRKQEMVSQLNSIANGSAPVDIEGWDRKMPTPEEMVAMLEKLKPQPMPLIPDIGDDIELYAKGRFHHEP